jgi:hypothetical protein
MIPGRSVLPSITLCLLLAGTAQGAEPEEVLASMTWLEGAWLGSTEEGLWEAVYSGPRGGTILSLNKQIVDGRAVLIEFEQFLVHEGEVVVFPSPGGRRADVHFTLTEHDAEARRAVFENPQHDFPQILTYHRHADDRLRIEVQARRDGGVFGFTIDLTRVECAPSRGSSDPAAHDRLQN